MARHKRKRKPANSAETRAALSWGTAYPVTAMRILANAGYGGNARAAFLREVIGLAEEHVPDYAADSFLGDEPHA